MFSHQALAQIAEGILGGDVGVETAELDSIQQIEVRVLLQQLDPLLGEKLSEVGQFANFKELAVELKAKGLLD